MRIYFLFLLTPSVAFAAATFVKTKTGQFILSVPRCEDLKLELDSISQWQGLADGVSCNPSSLSLSGRSPCEAEITNCLPEHVKKYHGTRPQISGPNCWNLSLVVSGLNKYLRYSTPEEMSLLMGPPLCHAVKSGEDRKPGDVIAIRTPSGEEVHGVLFVSPNLVYSKNGSSKNSPYELQSLEAVMKLYHVPENEDCRQNQSTSNKCENLTKVFRCQKLDEYLSEANGGGQYDEDIEALKKLESAECAISEKLFTGHPIPKESQQNITDIVNALAAYGRQETSKGDWKSDDKKAFHLALLRARINALSENLEVILDGAPVDSGTEELSRLFKYSQAEYNELRNWGK